MAPIISIISYCRIFISISRRPILPRGILALKSASETSSARFRSSVSEPKNNRPRGTIPRGLSSREKWSGLLQPFGRFLRQAQVDVFLNVDLFLHEAEVLRHIDIALEGLHVRQQIWIAIGVRLGKQPAKSLRR